MRLRQKARTRPGRGCPQGRTVGETLAHINHRFSGDSVSRGRRADPIREHTQIFIDGEREYEVSVKLKPKVDAHIFEALCGGDISGCEKSRGSAACSEISKNNPR
jgi:hypothetical protein